jgi:hypothetical protein
MPRQPDPSPPDRPYSRPLPFVRRAYQRRIEVFSPKLGRRLSLSSYGAWQLWLALDVEERIICDSERINSDPLSGLLAKRCAAFRSF